MFKRAVAAHAAKTEAAGPTSAQVRDGMEQIVCAHCGAPRHDEERICRFCKRAV